MNRMAIPYCRTDQYHRGQDSNDSETESVCDARRWPFVAHGIFCFTEQAPNENGNSNKNLFMKKPTLHIQLPCEEAKEQFEELWGDGGLSIQLHCDYGSHRAAMYGDGSERKQKRQARNGRR